MDDTPLSNDEPETETITYTRKRGRKSINPDLPREVIEQDHHSQYADGLPLYRIEKELARVGVDIQRTTLANWMIKTAALLSKPCIKRY